MATIGNLSVKVNADTTGLASGLKTSESLISGFTAKASALTDKLFAVGPAAIAAGTAIGVVMVKNVIDAADKLTDLSERTGIAIEDLSRLGYVAQMSGISAEEMTAAINRLSQGMALAAAGGGSASRVFDALGISVKNSDGTLREQVEVLKDIADKFQTYEDGAAKSALAMQLFGKTGANLVPVLNAGSAGIKKLSDESDRLGNTISTELAESSAQLNDNLDRLRVLSGNAAQSVATKLTPALVSLTDAMIANIEKVSEHSGVFTEMFDVLASKAAQSTSPMLRFLAILREANALASTDPFANETAKFARQGTTADAAKTAAPVIDEAAAKLAEEEKKAAEDRAKKRAEELEQIRQNELAKVQAFIDALRMREDARLQANMSEREQEEERYLLEQEKLLEALNLGLLTKSEYQLLEQEQLMAHREAMADIDIAYLQAQKQRDEQAAAERLRLAEQTASKEMQLAAQKIMSMTAAAASGSKELFEINKAASIANALLAARESVTSAYRFGARIGGPFLGAAFAATAALATATQVRQLASTSFNSGTSAAGSVGSAGGSSGTLATSQTAAAQPVSSAQSAPQIVSIQLQGDVFGREAVRNLISEINEAISDGAVLRLT
jgi:hypothetical protein